MSTDDLRRMINRHLDHLLSLQNLGFPPITCAIALLEGESPSPDYRARFSPRDYHKGSPNERILIDAIFHPSLNVIEPYSLTPRLGEHVPNYVTCLAAKPKKSDCDQSATQSIFSKNNRANNTISSTEMITISEEICIKLSNILQLLPEPLVNRLGFIQPNSPKDWVRVLFHLGWHFPSYGINVSRSRIVISPKDLLIGSKCIELDLQLSQDCAYCELFPGVVISCLCETTDFLMASEMAIRLLIESLDGFARRARIQPRYKFVKLHHAFSRQDRHDRFSKINANIYRLTDNIFMWQSNPEDLHSCDYENSDPVYFILSHLNANRVICRLSGPDVGAFLELAAQAGSLLPHWPVEEYPAILNSVEAYARYYELTKNSDDCPILGGTTGITAW